MMETYPLTKTELNTYEPDNTRLKRYVIGSKKIDQKIKKRTLQPDRAGSKRKKVSRPRRGMLTESDTNKIIINLTKKNIVDTTNKINNNDDKEDLKSTLKSTNRRRKDKAERKRCLARIASGDQCARNSMDDNEYCSCHHKHCPYGRIDGPLEGKFLTVPRKRGPKVRNNKEYKLDELDPMLYQQTEMVKINGAHYLIDKLGLLFTNDDSCEIVGRRLGDEIHWYI